MLTLLTGMFVYFLPTLVAVHRGHNITGILLLNFFFGWTGIGWIAMLLWALCARPSLRIVAYPQPYSGWYR